MSNMLDYVRWRGDLSFSASPPTEVDGLILSQMSMIRWEIALRDADSIGALAEQMRDRRVGVGFTSDNDASLLALAGASERFGGIRLTDYAHETDAEREKQFAAITLGLGDGSHFVAFRGTDDTLVGWQEDCHMAFSRPVPAQEAARDYLDFIARKYPGPLRVGGHSKGGNLAMYASATVGEEVLNRLEAVYSFDGPGLSDRMDAPALYARLGEKLRSFVPQGSIVGMLLAHPQAYTVVRSRSVSILQHDPYSWQVEGPRFVRMPALAQDSARFEAAFRRWLAQVDEEERAELVDTLFEILRATNAQTFGKRFWQGLAQNNRAVWQAIREVDPEKRARINAMIGELGRLALQPPEKNNADSKG